MREWIIQKIHECFGPIDRPSIDDEVQSWSDFELLRMSRRLSGVPAVKTELYLRGYTESPGGWPTRKWEEVEAFREYAPRCAPDVQ